MCDSSNRISTYATDILIDPCNPEQSIGTYDTKEECGCCSGVTEYCGSFTGQASIINPHYIFNTGAAFVAGIFEIYLETTTKVSTVPASAGDPQYKGAYYYYYINSTAVKMNVITSQGGLNNSSFVPAVDTTQISYSPGTGIVLNFNTPYKVGWKFSCNNV